MPARSDPPPRGILRGLLLLFLIMPRPGQRRIEVSLYLILMANIRAPPSKDKDFHL